MTQRARTAEALHVRARRASGLLAAQRLFLSGLVALAAVISFLIVTGPGGCTATPKPVSSAGPTGETAVERVELGTPAAGPGDVATAPTEPVSPGGSVSAARPLPVPPRDQPVVRVRIGDAVPAAELRFDHTQHFVWLVQPGTGNASTMAAPITVCHASDGWIVTARAGTEPAVRRFDGARPLEIHPLADAVQSISWGAVTWPGSITLHATANGVDVVDHVQLEEYVPGVIAKELLPAWDINAYRAQAVAARSYALVEMDRWATRRHFDVVAGERNQAFVGVTTRPQAVQGTLSTRGQVLTFDGKVVPAYYSSCCGGRGANVSESVSSNPHHDIWPLRSGDHGPRLSEVCCEGAKPRTWSVELRESDLRERLRAWGRAIHSKAASGLGPIVSVQRANANSAGRAIDYVVRDADGKSFTVPAEEFRVALNRYAPKGSPTIRSGDFEVTRAGGGRWLLSGLGFGHGCGLCQYGAQAMARGGADYRKILARYYPGADIVVAW